jgi:hypothetical protein
LRGRPNKPREPMENCCLSAYFRLNRTAQQRGHDTGVILGILDMADAGRKAPSSKTLRQLYVLSGNLCANPHCKTVLINANGTLVADVCHIKAEKSGGPRFDPKLSEEERRAPANLILLCNTCHSLVDREPQEYTVKVLTKWKRTREKRFAAIGDTLRQRYVAEIIDDAETGDITMPRSLKKYKRYLSKRRFTSEIDKSTLKKVRDYVNRLRHIDRSDRSLMRAIVEKGITMGGRRENEYGGIEIHPDDLKTIYVDNRRLSDYRIKKLGQTLDRNGLGGVDVDPEPQLQIISPDEDLGWSTLQEFLETEGKTLEDLICDLKFSLLD